MELINKYEGAVFFVDILGITALTNSKMNLTDEDYEPWLAKYSIEYSDQFLAASILAEFRDILIRMNDDFKDVTISQLSDCAFVWSKNITDIILFASKFMVDAIRKGILCRAGLTYGEIIETNQEHKLGRFIVGKAVTDAAKLERMSKGARILIDEEFPHNLWEQDKDFAERTIPLFTPFTNPLDYNIYDEFKWYLCPDLTRDINNLSVLSNDEQILLTKKRLKIANQVRCSPKYRWNSKSLEGLVQMRATINFISENKLLNILHNFDWSDVVSKRDDETVSNINRKIDNYHDYRIIVEKEERPWAE